MNGWSVDFKKKKIFEKTQLVHEKIEYEITETKKHAHIVFTNIEHECYTNRTMMAFR